MRDVRPMYRLIPLHRGEDMHRVAIRADCLWTMFFMEYTPRRMRLQHAPHFDEVALVHRLDDDEVFEVPHSHIMEHAVGNRRPDGWRVYVRGGHASKSSRGRWAMVHRDLVGPSSRLDVRVIPWNNR